MLSNGHVPTPVCSQAADSCTPFTMMLTTFSEGICVRSKGPRTELDYGTECRYVPEKSYVTAVAFVSRMVPKYFVTTVRVDGDEQAITHYQRIDFARRTKAVHFAETVNCFSKTKTGESYRSTLTYDPDYKQLHYVTKVDFVPVQKTLVQILPKSSHLASTCNGAELQGQSASRASSVLINGTA